MPQTVSVLMDDRLTRAIVIVLTGVIVAVLLLSIGSMGRGLARAGLLGLVVWTLALSRAIWTRPRWAEPAALLTHAAMAVVGLILAIVVLWRVQTRPGEGLPRIQLIAPAVVTICAGAVVALVSGSMRQRASHGDDDIGVSG